MNDTTKNPAAKVQAAPPPSRPLDDRQRLSIMPTMETIAGGRFRRIELLYRVSEADIHGVEVASNQASRANQQRLEAVAREAAECQSAQKAAKLQEQFEECDDERDSVKEDEQAAASALRRAIAKNTGVAAAEKALADRRAQINTIGERQKIIRGMLRVCNKKTADAIKIAVDAEASKINDEATAVIAEIENRIFADATEDVISRLIVTRREQKAYAGGAAPGFPNKSMADLVSDRFLPDDVEEPIDHEADEEQMAARVAERLGIEFTHG